MPKLVPFFPNKDDVRCQQACIKSVLKYFYPEREFTDKELDEGTAQTGGTTWFPPAVMFLDQVGLSVQLYTPANLDYEEFIRRGKEYIRDKTSLGFVRYQEENGAFSNFEVVQEAGRKMLEKQIVKREAIDLEELRSMLDSPEVLAIGKTIHPWLAGIHSGYAAHYVVVIKHYNDTLWRIHDPGPPPMPDRKVAKMLEGDPMFSEVLVITRKK